MNGMMQDFGTGPGGPMISGKWINKRTGAVINVRDSIINGDELVIITDKGQISMDEFSRNYIQASNDIFDESGKVIGHADADPSIVVESSTPNTVQTPMMSSNTASLTKPLNNKTQQTNHTTEKETEKEKLIRKIFDKNPAPTFTIDIDWTDFPKNELEMLINYFDISKEDIAQYLSKKVDVSELVGSIREFLESRLQ